MRPMLRISLDGPLPFPLFRRGASLTARDSRPLSVAYATAPLTTLTFAWTLPPERVVRPGETFEYHIGFVSNPLAFAFPSGTASTRFGGVSIPCP